MKKRYLIIAALILLFNGCSKVTKKNYDKIESGMSYEDVVKLIGKSEGCSETLGISSCEWKNGDANIVVTFVLDQVTIKTSDALK